MDHMTAVTLHCYDCYKNYNIQQNVFNQITITFQCNVYSRCNYMALYKDHIAWKLFPLVKNSGAEEGSQFRGGG